MTGAGPLCAGWLGARATRADVGVGDAVAAAAATARRALVPASCCERVLDSERG